MVTRVDPDGEPEAELVLVDVDGDAVRMVLDDGIEVLCLRSELLEAMVAASQEPAHP